MSINMNFKVHEYLWIWIWLSMKLLWTPWLYHVRGKMMWAIRVWISPKTENCHTGHIKSMNWNLKLGELEICGQRGRGERIADTCTEKVRIMRLYVPFCEKSVFYKFLCHTTGKVQVLYLKTILSSKIIGNHGNRGLGNWGPSRLSLG